MSENNMAGNIGKHMLENAPAHNAIVEAQVAYSIVDLLDAHAKYVSDNVAESLSATRKMAVNQLAEQQAQAVVLHDVNQSGNVLQWFGDNVGQYFGRHRFMSFTLMGVAILLAFFALQQSGINNNLEHSDAFLLASDLPPEAYSDKGFDTWLDTTTD